ncbi:tRNA pseudouridine38-40 synthase [Hypnocyclicus thermotrophus]|uniref:tRNA pseudouridine synthase A n=1 Tax=Hypnocyclicus thermotrophus TaxID=1627895 RepID=A0AA46I5S9_9FUSO|nr:tRNA pseudouridine(38-40) synthase TruA [Hypnocyclicus thermotrophus]TDT70628.1 tRNA pseudouridine38-40 synthase [Hypnocyclicus thermotrophus]
MRNIKITYQYNGSNFYGMQRQNEFRTVQGEIEKALNKLFREKITIKTSGRTDRGVHALFQVSNFLTNNKTIPVEKLTYILNRGLPKDIHILDTKEVELEFNSRFSAKDRAYIYKMCSQKNPFDYDKVMNVKEEINEEKLKKILTPLLGEHNFDSFRKSDCEAKNNFREIKEIKCYRENNYTIVYLKANAFLKSMVRIIIGSALAVYFGERDENYIINKLKDPNINDEKILAEPQGLYLCEINY